MKMGSKDQDYTTAAPSPILGSLPQVTASNHGTFMIAGVLIFIREKVGNLIVSSLPHHHFLKILPLRSLFVHNMYEWVLKGM